MTPPSLRIVHITPRYCPAIGGAELYFSHVANAAAANGHRVDVWTTVADRVGAFWNARAPRFVEGEEQAGPIRIRRHGLRYVPARPFVLTPLHLLPFGTTWRALTQRWNPHPRGLWRASRAEGPIDLVHAGWLPYSNFLHAGLRLARRSGARLAFTPFTHLSAAVRRTYLAAHNIALLAEADVVFVQTGLEREALAAAGVPAERLALAGLGVDPDDCTGGDGAAARQRWRVPDGAPVIGHLATLSREKGTFDLLAAFRTVADRRADAWLVLAGDELPRFASEWKAAGGHDRVVRLGRLSDREKRDFLAAIDVLALPSYVDSFGIVLLEAAVNGVPAVAYREGGPAEIVEHERTGLLVPAGDIAALAAAIDRYLADRALREAHGEAARERSARATWAEVESRVLGEYDRLIQSGTPV